MTQIKVCGIRRIEDAQAAHHLGIHMAGVNFAPESPRFVGSIEAAETLVCSTGFSIAWAGVFVNADSAFIIDAVKRCGLSVVQLHGDEPSSFATALRKQLPSGVKIWKAFAIANAGDVAAIETYDCDVALLDAKVPGARGGSGQTFDWTILEKAKRSKPWAMAGGLKPENVSEAVKRVHPDWVDTASGVESAPGVKDRSKMEAFARAVKS